MKKIGMIFVGLFCAFTSQASTNSTSVLTEDFVAGHASDQREAIAGENYYADIGAMYAKGSVPSIEEMTGWFAGRCARDFAPNETQNLVYIGWAGKGIYAGNQSQAPDFFDVLTQENERQINELLAREKDNAIDASVEDGALLTNMKEAQSKWLTRKVGGHYVMQIVYNGAVKANCILFKRLK